MVGGQIASMCSDVSQVIDDQHNLLRHLRATDIENGIATSTGFEVADHVGLSFSWVEYFDGPFDDQVKKAIVEVCDARKIKASHRFGRIVIEDAQKLFSSEGLEKPIPEHRRMEKFDAHAEINRKYLAERLAATLLARAVTQLHEPVTPS